MSRIFISHSSQDNPFAKQLADALQARGAEVWIDLSDIPAGMKWSTAIQHGLDVCELMILIITPASMASTNVEDEWQYYLDNHKLIIPVRWIPAKTHFQLGRHQYVDFYQQDFDAALTRLERELARHGFSLNHSSTPPRIQGGETDAPVAPPRVSAEREAVGTTPASSAAARPVIKPLSSQTDVRPFPRLHQPAWVGKLIPEPFEWCEVPAGKVTLTDTGGYLKEATTFDLPEFQIARYPITNAQFEVFVTANDGWRDAGWWDYSDAARAWRKQNPQSEPAYFKDCGDCPRETVTWYAAVAFTRWLSAKTGEAITLPTEQQWQRAAQGDDGRAYPWGDAWAAANCNSEESGVGKTTPVTQYPPGASPFGALDMSGNVWEWCLTDYTSGKNDFNIHSEYRVLRGGSWNLYLLDARAASRLGDDPNGRYLDLGFRVVCAGVPI